MRYKSYSKLFGNPKKISKNKFNVNYTFKDYSQDINLKISDEIPKKKSNIKIIEINIKNKK